MSETVENGMSIGELAEKVGVPVATIRTWERRYGLPAPARTPGGHRRYGADHLLWIASVRQLVDRGATVVAAARRVSEASNERRSPSPPVPLSTALDGGAIEAAYSATRALLRIRQPAQAVEILVQLVRELGGEVVEAEHAPPDALPLDLSFGERAPLLPVTEPYSIARLHLERMLPTLLDDARHMMLLTRRLQDARGRSQGKRGKASGIASVVLADRFLELLERGDQPGAFHLVTDLVRQGVSPEALVLEVLAPAQQEVGRRWEDGRWGVAQEHAATAVTDAALGLLALDAEPLGKGHAVVGCVEGEWHALPARMAAEILRMRGWEVVFLGPSVPAEDLARYLAMERADVVGLSCSMPLLLKGAARSIDVCRQAGVPVLAGGIGFGAGGRYAIQLGATAWAPDPAMGVRLLEDWMDQAPQVLPAPVPLDAEHLAIEAEKAEIVTATLAALGCDASSVRAALTFLVDALENAVFIGDADVMVTCWPAAERLLLAGDPAPSASSTFDALLTAVEGRFPSGQRLMQESRSLAAGGRAGAVDVQT